MGDLAQAFDHSDEGFALTDPEGSNVYINDAHLHETCVKVVLSLRR